MPGEAAGDQTAVIKFLMTPQSYAHAPPAVDRIDTHGAMIFLAGDRAYKLKRAVKLAYLDFSTLEKRRAVCEHELALNSRTAPGLYLGVLPITRSCDGGLGFGGEGEVVDWVIEMLRFDDEQLFDKLACAGRLDASFIVKLAQAIERFHAGALQKREASWPESLGHVLDNVVEALGHHELSDLGMDGAISGLCETFEREWDLLDARRAAGFVRRCHGDLHLKNIVLLEGEPCLFDALEFDDELATIDVLYDLAFLLMDLWHRELKAEANAIFNHYLGHEHSQLESAGLALMPFFMSLRAGVRAMVGLDGLAVSNDRDRARLLEETRSYAQLCKLLIAPSPQRIVAIGGISGTGKTTVAAAIAPLLGAAPGAIHLRSDVERKRLFGVGPTDHLDDQGYTPAANDRVYGQMRMKADTILSAGHSVIFDATFLRARDRSALAELAQKFGVALEAVWLEAEEVQMIARVGARCGDASDADMSVVRKQMADHASKPSDWLTVDARGDAEDTARRAAEALGVS